MVIDSTHANTAQPCAYGLYYLAPLAKEVDYEAIQPVQVSTRELRNRNCLIGLKSCLTLNTMIEAMHG
jgi:hypothetical protein